MKYEAHASVEVHVHSVCELRVRICAFNSPHINENEVRVSGTNIFFLQQAGSLIVIGTAIFCGTCYYYALSGSKNVRQYTPYGGMLLIVGWLAMVI